MTQPQQSQYIIDNITFVESFFKKESNIDLTKPIDNNINIETKSDKQQEGDNVKITVELTTEINGLQDESIDVYQCRLVTLGVFQKIGQSDLNEDFFSKVNAPAIMFPFIREAFFSLALKAGIGNVYLPTINFVKKYKDSMASDADSK